MRCFKDYMSDEYDQSVSICFKKRTKNNYINSSKYYKIKFQ